jgi:uncharacterized membrane protein
MKIFLLDEDKVKICQTTLKACIHACVSIFILINQKERSSYRLIIDIENQNIKLKYIFIDIRKFC